MVDAHTTCGAEFRLPSYDDLKGPLLCESVDDIQVILDKQCREWKKGCIIMSYGWIDGKIKRLINFLVAS